MFGLNETQTTLIFRFVRGAAAAAIASALAFIGTENAELSNAFGVALAPIVTGFLLAADKKVRDGGKP